jgi:hypothetical protein
MLVQPGGCIASRSLDGAFKKFIATMEPRSATIGGGSEAAFEWIVAATDSVSS